MNKKKLKLRKKKKVVHYQIDFKAALNIFKTYYCVTPKPFNMKFRKDPFPSSVYYTRPIQKETRNVEKETVKAIKTYLTTCDAVEVDRMLYQLHELALDLYEPEDVFLLSSVYVRS